MNDDHLAKAEILIEQQRFAQAEVEVRTALAKSPDDGEAHAYLALCRLGQDDVKDAFPPARRAIELSPDVPFPHYVFSLVSYYGNRNKEAERAATEAIRLAPYWSARPYFLLGQIHLLRLNANQALQFADRGLEVEPEDIDCLNLRGQALAQLGQKGAAGRSIDAALALDPEAPESLAAKGWQLLETRKYKGAAACFQQALGVAPDYDYAREGMTAVIRATDPLGRYLIRLSLFNLLEHSWIHWIFWVPLYLGFKLLYAISFEAAELPPVLVTIAVLWGLVCVFLLSTEAVGNLLLISHPYGKYTLTQAQRRTAIVGGAALAVAIASGLTAIADHTFAAGVTTIVCGGLCLPIQIASRSQGQRSDTLVPALTAGLASFGAAAIAISVFGPQEMAFITALLFVVACFAFILLAAKVLTGT